MFGINRIRLFWANRSFKSKRDYLLKQGAIIGNGTRLISPISALGSEPYLVTIGKNCLISSDVNFFTHDGGVKVLNSLNYFNQRHDKMGLIRIGDNCFIGHGAIILPNVSIGSNCVIGAGSVVCKNIPSNEVWAGVPAKRICSIEEYYKKNLDNFFPTPMLKPEEKRSYLEEHLKKDNL